MPQIRQGFKEREARPLKMPIPEPRREEEPKPTKTPSEAPKRRKREPVPA